jgi:hypothetical protein
MILNYSYQPAIKLLTFYRTAIRTLASETEEAGELPYLNCDKMKEISSSFASLQPLGQKDIEAWVSFWISRGLLRSDSCGFAAL